MENYSLADISAVTGKDTSVLGGGGSGLWIFATFMKPAIFAPFT